MICSKKWADRYLALAKEVSTWSKDPSTKVGCVVVGDKGQVLTQGYNGFPRGIIDRSSRFKTKEAKYKYTVHAEMNAIYNATFNGVSLDKSTLYCYGLPVCAECAKGVIQVGIRKVVVLKPSNSNKKWEESCKEAMKMFEEVGIPCMIYEEKDVKKNKKLV